MKKITCLSNLLMTSFIIYFVWIVGSFVYSWLILKYPTNSPLRLTISAIAFKSPDTTPLPPNIFTMNAPLLWKTVYSLETILIFGLYLFFTGNAIRLFWLYSNNVIFDLRCVKHIKRAGIALFIINTAHLICPAINTYILSHELWLIPKVLFFGTEQATILVVSLLLIVTSWIMEESYKIHDEQQYTV